MKRVRQHTPAETRVWTHFQAGDPDSCWLWSGHLLRGYGTIKIKREGRWVAVRAHRFVYELLVGPIPDGLQLDHLCRVRHCVNPTHLEPVTSRENTLRGDTITAAHAARTHCSRGHEYTAGNTSYSAHGARVCKCCQRIKTWLKRGIVADWSQGERLDASGGLR